VPKHVTWKPCRFPLSPNFPSNEPLALSCFSTNVAANNLHRTNFWLRKQNEKKKPKNKTERGEGEKKHLLCLDQKWNRGNRKAPWVLSWALNWAWHCGDGQQQHWEKKVRKVIKKFYAQPKVYEIIRRDFYLVKHGNVQQKAAAPSSCPPL